MPRLFVFDMDDVIYDYDGRARLAAITASTGHLEAELRRRWWNLDGEGAAEAGAFADGAEYLAAVNAALEADFLVDEWVDIRRSAMQPRHGVIEFIAGLRAIGRVSLLTNNGPLVQERMLELAPELAELIEPEHLRTSWFYGARKPDPTVFVRVLEAYGTDADEVFFTDDLAPNAAAAASVGIHSHRFVDLAGLASAVGQFVAATD